MSPAPAEKRPDPDAYPPRNWLVFSLFLAYVFYHYLQVGYRIPALGQMRGEFILGAVLSVLAFASLAQGSDKRTEPAVKWALWLIALMVVMVVFSVDPGYSWNIFFDRVIKFGMLALFIATFVRSPGDLRWFLAVYLLVFLKMGQEGLVGVLGGSQIWENQGVLRLHGSTPTYHHPNSFSGTQVGTLPFLIFLFPLLPRVLKVAALVQAFLALWVVLFTASRTGYLGLASAVGVAISLARSRAKAIGVALLIGAVALPLIPEQYIGRAATIFHHDDSAEYGSISARKEIQRDAWAIFLDNPFGVGVGAFPIVRNERFGRTQDTHNLYLEIGTNLGIQGLVIFSGLLITMFSSLFALRKNTESQLRELEQLSPPSELDKQSLEAHRRDVALIRATALALICFLIVRVTLGLFGMDLYEIYWWFAIGLVVALSHVNQTAKARTDGFVNTVITASSPVQVVAKEIPSSMFVR